MRSVISFDSPYGFVGVFACDSSMGTVVGSPYVAAVEENTKRPTS